VYLFIVLFLCLVNGFSRNSRLDGFNSRLGRHKFPFGLATGIRGKHLNLLAILTADRRRREENRKNSRLNGKNREGWPLFTLGNTDFELFEPDLGGGVGGGAPIAAGRQ
jgi:hypothetical protein